MQGCRLTDQCVAEFIGTFLFITLGLGCVAAAGPGGVGYSPWETGLIWGLSVALSAYIVSGISGAHLNPAVTIAFALFHTFPKKNIAPYILAQCLGAFAAAAAVYCLYDHLIPVKNINSAGVFVTAPSAGIHYFQAFFAEFFATAILVALIAGLSDDKNGLPRGVLAPLLVGLTVAVILGAFSPLTGAAINPARDFGPRLFLALSGWGAEVWRTGAPAPYFLVPLLAPILGGIAGAFCYIKLIGEALARRNLTLMSADNNAALKAPDNIAATEKSTNA